MFLYFTTLPLCPDQGFGRMDDQNAIVDLDREMGVLQNLTSRAPRFTAVDDLLLEREDPAERRHASVEFLDRFGGPRDQNQYFRGGSDTRRGSDTNLSFLQPRFSRFSHISEPSLGGFHFPIQSKTVTGGGDFNLRRASGVQNVTTRETKRPKEREKHKEYRRRILTGVDLPFCTFHSHIPTDRAGAPPSSAERQSRRHEVPAAYANPPRSIGSISLWKSGRPRNLAFI